jgi:proteasome lid subunit RPN8/RPN11
MKAKTKTASGQPFLLVDSEVVRKIRQHARAANATEICGVLIGQDKDQRIEVMASIEGENADQAGAHVTFTQDTWEHIYAVKDKKYPNERIVGWYHSHPGFGIFLSEHDTFIHKNFFSSPGQVAWVFDPHSDEEGCFGWVNGRIERLTRIAVQDRRGGEAAESGTAREAMASVVSGNGAAEHSSEPANGRIRVMRDETGETSGDSSISLEELVTKVFFSLALLLLGGVLSWYLVPHPVFVPVIADPSGKLLDAQTGEVVGEWKSKNGGAGPADPAKTGQPSRPDAGKKGDDAKSK